MESENISYVVAKIEIRVSIIVIQLTSFIYFGKLF